MGSVVCFYSTDGGRQSAVPPRSSHSLSHSLPPGAGDGPLAGSSTVHTNVSLALLYVDLHQYKFINYYCTLSISVVAFYMARHRLSVASGAVVDLTIFILL